MKKKKKQKKRIIIRKPDVVLFAEDVINRIQREHGLSDYRMKVKSIDEENGNVMAEIRVDNEYLRATVTLYSIFIQRYRDKKYEELKEALCHEIFHIRTSSIEEMAVNRWGTPDIVRSEIERLTEIYGRLIYKVMTLEGKFKNVKTTYDTPKRKTRNKKRR